jgi:hypothetical protein
VSVQKRFRRLLPSLLVALSFGGLLWGGFAGACRLRAKPMPNLQADAGISHRARIEAPETLLAEIVVPMPQAALTRIQAAEGGVLGLLPNSFGGCLALAAGLPLLWGDEIDGASPAFAAIDVVVGTVQLDYAVAVKVKDGRRIRSLISGVSRGANESANGSREQAEEGASEGARAGITAFEVATGSGRVSVGFTTNEYLLFGSSREAVVRLGPYLTRSLPDAPLPSETLKLSMPGAALAGVLAPWIRATWATFRKQREVEDQELRRSHGGKAPDFAEPSAILDLAGEAVERRLAWGTRLSALTLTLDLQRDGLRIAALAQAREGDKGIAELAAASAQGAATPLLLAPADVAASALFRDRESARLADASAYLEQIGRALGARLPARERSAVEATLKRWALGRGEMLRTDVYWGRRRNLVWSTRTRRAPDFLAAATEFSLAFRRPYLGDPFRIVSVELRERSLQGAPWFSVLMRRGGKASAASALEGAFYADAAAATGDSLATAAFGSDAVGLLQRLQTVKETLGDIPEVRALVQALGDHNESAYVVRPTLAWPSAANALNAATVPANTLNAATVPAMALGWGFDGAQATARAEVPYALLREAARALR